MCFGYIEFDTITSSPPRDVQVLCRGDVIELRRGLDTAGEESQYRKEVEECRDESSG